MAGTKISALAEEYIPKEGTTHLGKGLTVLLTPGDNFPNLDTAAAQYAANFGLNTLLKIDPAISLEGVPRELNFQEACSQGLINKTSATMCEERGTSVIIFNDIFDLGKVLSGDYQDSVLIHR